MEIKADKMQSFDLTFLIVRNQILDLHKSQIVLLKILLYVLPATPAFPQTKICTKYANFWYELAA